MLAIPEFNDMTTAELTTYAHEVGIDSLDHLRRSELVEAIEQQRETNGILLREEPPASRAHVGTDGHLPVGGENFR